MSKCKISRRNDIDFLKGIAIISVVLYHMGILKSGYLGVDVFFVIAGFLTVPSLLRKVSNSQFSYIKFVWKRVIRLLPLILIVSALCLIIGYVFWLPDDYENLSESIIASIAFSNNILAGITTKNYWDTVNDYKPLMHMWYLGILMEFYLLVPLITLILNKLSKLFKLNSQKILGGGYCILTIISLLLFLNSNFSAGDKFYFIPFRFYELMVGGLIGININKLENLGLLSKKRISWISFGLLISLLCISIFTLDIDNIGVETVVIGQEIENNLLVLPNEVLVLTVVLATALLLISLKSNTMFSSCRCISAIGKRSYSIFIWHQVMLALYRYSISSRVTLLFLISFLISLVLVSGLSYRFIEQKINVTMKNSVITVIGAIFICVISAFLYFNAGVVRDVPELGISVNSVHRNMHAEYCDRVNDYDVAFDDNNKIKVLIVGNSYARDFGNILLESAYSDDIELAYSSSFKDSIVDRIKQADRIFVFDHKDNVPDYLWKNAKNKDIVYGIGTKNFGTLNGQIYFNRFKKDYFSQTVKLDPGYKAVNDDLSNEWGNNYINLLEAVLHNGRISVFTDTNMFISQDTKHLTKAGAQFYSKILNLKELIY